MSLLIRQAVPSDLALATQLLTAQLTEHDLPADPKQVSHGINLALANPTTWLLLAFRNDEAVAIFLANEIISVEKSGRVLWVEELYVIPSARRTGVARALLTHVATAARKKGIVTVELEVVPTQAPAFALYQAMGFVNVDRRRMSWEI
jgi:GNAT superfamily N-acetyltransferase